MDFDSIYAESSDSSSYSDYAELRPGTRRVSWKSTCCPGDTFVTDLKIKGGEKIEPNPVLSILDIEESPRDRMYEWRVRQNTIEERRNELVDNPDDEDNEDEEDF